MRIRLILSVLVACSLVAQQMPPSSGADPAVLLIRVIQGAGAVYKTGARTPSAIIVEINDENGKPVPGAAVSFRLLPDGSVGVFSSGITTDVAITGQNGRASASGVRWGQAAGPVEVRVAAAKGEARAGTRVPIELADSNASAGRIPDYYPSSKKRKVIWVVVAAAGASVAAGLAYGRHSQTSNEAASVSLGTPTITVGNP